MLWRIIVSSIFIVILFVQHAHPDEPVTAQNEETSSSSSSSQAENEAAPTEAIAPTELNAQTAANDNSNTETNNNEAADAPEASATSNNDAADAPEASATSNNDAADAPDASATNSNETANAPEAATNADEVTAADANNTATEMPNETELLSNDKNQTEPTIIAGTTETEPSGNDTASTEMMFANGTADFTAGNETAVAEITEIAGITLDNETAEVESGETIPQLTEENIHSGTFSLEPLDTSNDGPETEEQTEEEFGNTEEPSSEEIETDEVETEKNAEEIEVTHLDKGMEEHTEPFTDENEPTEDGEGEDNETDIDEMQVDDNILGEYAAMVAYTLRENLLNLFGYLMYQVTVDTEPEVYFYIHELRTGLEANNVDTFKLISVLPQLYKKKLNDQLRDILQRVEQVCDVKFCHVKCTARMWRRHSIGIDMEMAVGHFGYNPILIGIVDKQRDLRRLKALVKKMETPFEPDSEMRELTRVFSIFIVRIIHEVQERQTSLTDRLVGYLLPFYPWPLDDYDVDLALSTMTRFLIDERTSLIRCGVEIRKDLVSPSLDSIMKLMNDIMNSKCNRAERLAAQVILRTLQTELTIPDYRNTFKGVYAEINRLWDLLDIVDHENYPLEVVLARERLKRYMDKVVFYLNYPRFVAYKYKTSEETLIAFLDFVIQETPHLPLHIKMSVGALRAHLLFYTGPRKISYSLLLTIVDAFLAPDFNDNIIDQFIAVKTYILDEAVNIGRILQSVPTKKCTDLLACYFEIIAILKESSAFTSNVHHLEVPECVLMRFMNKHALPDDLHFKLPYGHVKITDLLDTLDYHQFTREIVLSGGQVKDYIQQYQEKLTIPTTNIFCTKQETLLDYLEHLLGNNPKYPAAITASIKAIIPALTFKLTPIRNVNVEIIKLITKAWHSPFTDQKTMLEITRMEAIIQSNEKDLDNKLYDMDPHDCVGLLECYNAIVEHLENIDSAFNFKTREMLSPELYVLNLGSPSQMTTKLIVDIVTTVQTHQMDDSELEAAKSYIMDFELDIDMVIKEVDCSGKQVIPCFSTLLDKMRFSEYISHVEINIVQYLLTPTTCDKRNCWWYPNEELGCTILNPLLQYIMYLLGHYSANEINSLHLQMDINQIVQYLDAEDVDDILTQFKIKVYNSNLEKIKAFLELLKHSTLLEEHVLKSVKNVYAYISQNLDPETLNIGNLFYLKQLFKSYTLNTTVHVELDEIEVDMRSMGDDITALLETLYINCYALGECIREIEVQLNTIAFDKPAGKLIKLLLKPNSCIDDKTICPWIVPGVTGTHFIQEIAIPEIQQHISTDQISLIEKIVWKVVMDKLKDNPDIISGKVLPPDENLTTQQKLDFIIEKLLEQEHLPDDIKKNLEQIKISIKDLVNGYPVDVDIVMEILDKMIENTKDETICSDIENLKVIIDNNKKVFNGILSNIQTTCKTLKECVQDIFDGVVKQKVADKEIIKMLLEVLLAEKCPKGDCPWQVTADIKKCTILKAKLEDLLMEIESKEDTPFHVKLDIYDALDYLDKADVLQIINSVLVFNVFTRPDHIIQQIMHEISLGTNVPAQIKVSIKNIMNYINEKQVPTFLQVSNLMRFVIVLKEQTTSRIVERIMNNAVVFLKRYKENATAVLEQSAVDCSTLESCVNTLYVEMERQIDDNAAQIILTVLKPSVCKPTSCPWIKQLVAQKMKEVKEILRKELEALQKGKEIPLIIKLDVQVFKKIIEKCPESLAKVADMLTQDKAPEKLLPLFIKTLDSGVLEEHDMQHIKVDLENYLASGAVPKYIDVNTLLMYGELLKRITKSDAVKRDIEQQKVKIVYEKADVRKVMLNCPVSCVSVKKCAETIEMCLQHPPVNDEPSSVTVAKMVRPDSCDRRSCPWLPQETREELMAKFESIKDEIKQKINDEEIPVIIRIMLMLFLKQFEFDKPTERNLQHITPNHPNKFLELLKQLKKDKANQPPDLVEQVVKMIDYFMSKKIPDYLTSAELPGLIMLLVDLSQQPDVKDFLEAALNLVMKKREDVDATLKACPVQCVTLMPCMATLAECLQKSESITAVWIIHLIYPDPCTPMVCPWMPDDFVGVETPELPIKAPHTIYPNKVILFFQDFKKLKSITFDLTKDRTLVMLEAFTFLAESHLRRTTVVNAKGSPKKYLIDYKYLKGIRRAGKEFKPVIDFSKEDSKIICVRYKNGQYRPLKFDLRRDGVREALKRLTLEQRVLVNDQKPVVTIADEDGSRTTFTIDVLDSNIMRKILEQTLDDVMPQSYTPVFFWPKDMGEPWKAAIIEEKSLIEAFLRNLPGMDMANKATPVVVMFDGIITMDFDVNNIEIVQGIETAVGDKEAVLDLSIQKKYMFYIPFPFQKNMIPLPVDFNDPNTLDILIKASEKFKVSESSIVTLIVKKEDGESVSLQFDFYGDIFVYLFHTINKRPGTRPPVDISMTESSETITTTTTEKIPINTGDNLNLVIIFVNQNEDYVLLDLKVPTVRERLMEFTTIPHGKHIVVINVPDNQGNPVPVVIDPDNRDVVDVLKALSQKTSEAFQPVNVITADDKHALVCVAMSGYLAIAVFIEDTVANAEKLTKGGEKRTRNEFYHFNFDKAQKGVVKVTGEHLAQILSENPPKVTSVGLTYVGAEVNLDEIVVPLKIRGVHYHITLSPLQPEVSKVLHEFPYTDKTAGTTFVAKDPERSNPLFLVTLPNSPKTIEKLRPFATKIQTDINTDNLMVILTVDDALRVKSFILDLSNEKVPTILQDMSASVDPESSTKVLYNIVDADDEIIPIVLDHMEYDLKVLEGLEQETPADLKTINIPNLDSPSPLVGFMVLDAAGNKMSIVLNPADSLVWRALTMINKRKTANSTAIKVVDRRGKQHVMMIDKTNPKVVNKLKNVAQRTTPSHIPVKPIPADGSSIITIYVMEDRFKVKKKINTKDDVALKQLLDAAENLPVTEPEMLIVKSDGKAMAVRVDTRVYGHQNGVSDSYTSVSSENNFMVLKPSKSTAIVVDVMDPIVAIKIKELMEEGDNQNAQTIVYVDNSGQTQTLKLDTSNATLVQELWKLQQITMPSNLPPFVVAPENGKFYYVFMITDESGNKRVIILDISNSQVKSKLIEMSDASGHGVPVKLEDGKGGSVTIHLDTSNKAVINNLIVLSELTALIPTPIVSGINTDKIKIIKIPIQEDEKNYLINCNVSDPLLIRQLIGLYGKKSNGVVFTLKNRRGLPAVIYLDLSSKKVIEKLSKICDSKATVLDPSQVLIFDIQNVHGEHVTNVLDLTNEDIVKELIQNSKVETGNEDNPSVISIPLFDESGNPVIHKIDISNPEIQQLLAYLSGITIGNQDVNSIYIPDTGGISKIVIIFGASGPLFIDQSNEALVDQILQHSSPNNPDAIKIVFTVRKDKIKIGYFDVNDSELMQTLQQIIDRFFNGQQVIPPPAVPKQQIIRVPCINREGQGILILLDISNNDVVEVLERESADSSDRTFNMKISIMRNGVIIGVYYIDTTDVQTCEQLKLVAFLHCYQPEDGSLLVMNIPDQNFPVIILDMSVRRVKEVLESMSEKVSMSEATHLLLYLGSDARSIIFKINIKSPGTVTKLKKLMEYTPVPISPIAIANPYGSKPLVIFTIRLSTGEVKHVVLNLDNSRVIHKVKELSDKIVPAKPLEITYVESNGRSIHYVLDATNDTVIMELYKLMIATLPITDAVLNIPQKNPRLYIRLIISIENDSGFSGTYAIDMADQKQMEDFKNRAPKVTKQAHVLILYFRDHRDFVEAIRVDPKVLFPESPKGKPIIQLNPKYVLIITIINDKGRVVPIILYVKIKKVLLVLIQISQMTPIDKPHSVVTIETDNGELVTIHLDLKDTATQVQLLDLMQETPHPIEPIVVVSPFGTKPLLVLTIEGPDGKTLAIFIDLNNNVVVQILDQISNPSDEEGWSVKIPGVWGIDITIYINPNLNDVKDKLIEISAFIQFIPAPIRPNPVAIVFIQIKLEDNSIVEIPLNIKDPYVIEVLIQMIKDWPSDESNGIQIIVESEEGVNTPINIDITKPEIIEIMLQLGQRVMVPSVFVITPETGEQPLIIGTIALPDGIVVTIIDVNNPKIIDKLQEISEPVTFTTEVTIIQVKPEYGKPFDVIIDKNKNNIREELITIVTMSPLFVCPLKVIPPGGKNPILSMVVKLGHNATLLVIDFNNEKVVEILQTISLPDSEGVTNIEFLLPNGTKDSVNLNLTEPFVIHQIKDLVTPPVYPVPVKTEHPAIVVVEQGEIKKILDLTNPEIVDILISESGTEKDKDTMWTLEIKNKEGLSIIVYINFDGPSIMNKVKDLIMEAEVPPINVIVPDIIKVVEVCPVKILPPGGKYPLIMIVFWDIGPVTWDINQEDVLHNLTTITDETESDTIIIEVPDQEGNLVIIKLQPDDKETETVINNLPQHPIISFTPSGKPLPILLITVQDTIYELDLTNPTIIATLQDINNPNSEDAFTIQIPLPIHTTIIHLVPEDLANPDIKIPNKIRKLTTLRPPIDIISEFPTTTSRYPDIVNVNTTTKNPDEDIDWPWDFDTESTPHYPDESPETSWQIGIETSSSTPYYPDETSEGVEKVTIDDSWSTPHYPDESSETPWQIGIETSSSTPYYPDETSEGVEKVTIDDSWSTPYYPDESPETHWEIDFETSTSPDQSSHAIKDVTVDDDTTTPSYPGGDDHSPETDDAGEPILTLPTNSEGPDEVSIGVETVTDNVQVNVEKPITEIYPNTSLSTDDDVAIMTIETLSPETISDHPDASIPDHSILTITPLTTLPHPNASIPDHSDGHISMMTTIGTSEHTTRYTTTTRRHTTTPHFVTTVIEGHPPNEVNYIYWVTFNLTNLVTFETHTYIFDVSNVKVVTKLKEYVLSLQPNEKIITVTLPLPDGPFVLHINPYDQETFKIFAILTVISTGRYPVQVGVGKLKIWWNFTITDQYQNPLKIELDVANELVLQKIQELNNMFRPGGGGVIIKGTLPNGKEYQLILDLKCTTTLENLLIIMEISHGGPDRPLKQLPGRVEKPSKYMIKFEINLPGAGQVLTIVLDIGNKEVLDALIELDKQYVEGNANYLITITVGDKTYKIHLNLWDKTTLETLLHLTEISTGEQVISKETLEMIIQMLYLPALLTIEINDGKESLPVTVDVSDKYVLEILGRIQTKQQDYATVINFVDTKNVTHRLSLNINDRQVIGILLAIGLPTISPRKAVQLKLLTFIFIKEKVKGGYKAILLDLANRGTIIFFLELVARYVKQFKSLTYVELRDDNGQYVPVAIDLYHDGFVKALERGSLASKRHRIEWADIPFLVFVIPNRSKNKYDAYKLRLNYLSFEELKKLKYGRKPVGVQVVDSPDAEYFYVDPEHSDLVNGLVRVPGIALIQHSRPKPMIILYIVERRTISPIYLNIKDPRTLNKLIEMHNSYARTNGREPLTVVRFVTADKETHYLLLHLNNQVAMKELSRLTVQVGAHHFVKQRIEKVATLSIPQKNGQNLLIRLNLADPYVLSELRRMSRNQLQNKYVQTLIFTDAYNNPLVLKLDFYDPNVVSQLIKLSMK